MGSKFSCEDQQDVYDSYVLKVYEAALEQPCVLPDVGIDSSLLKYSGIDSNAVLQSYSDDLINQVPGYIDRLGSSFGSMTSFPNAVGLGALVISMIMEIVMKSSTRTTDDSYSMFRRVFGEEKASGVRDTMSEYVKRHKMYLNDERLLQMEIQRLEKQLSNHLTVLRNSLLLDGQMRSRGFNIWVNGASFHIQMLIHEARLNIQTGIRATDYVQIIQGAISTYLQDLNDLLEKYKTLVISTTHIYDIHVCGAPGGCGKVGCYVAHDEKNCGERDIRRLQLYLCHPSCIIEPYVNHVFSNHEPLSGLKSHFSNIKSNLNYLINQRNSFRLPAARTFSIDYTMGFGGCAMG